MKSIITEKGVTFKKLEKNIYSWICRIGCQFTSEFLERYDQMLMRERDKSRYRHKGTRQTTIKTVYGDVTYSRVVYEVTEEYDGWKKTGKDRYSLSEKVVAAGSYREVEAAII